MSRRTNIFKVLFLLLVISLFIMSSYMFISLDSMKIDKNKNKTPLKPNKINNNVIAKSSDLYTPIKKVIIVEKEIIKEAVNEVCNNIELKEQENKENKETIINNNYGFKDNLTMVNYFLTYQYYHLVEEYKNVQYLNKSKYGLSQITFPKVQRITSNFTPTIEETDKNIQLLRESHQSSNNNGIVGHVSNTQMLSLDNNQEYQKLLLKQVRARVWDEFYTEYGKYNNFIQFSMDHGFTIQPPRPSLPLDTSGGPLLSKPYLFIHIPKAGGSSLIRFMKNHFNTGVLQQWTYPNSLEIQRVQAANNVILGHFYYGIHKELLPESQKKCNYMTMLRDPVDRVISHYFYHKGRKDDEEHKLAADNSFEQWIIKSPRGNNEMTRLLSGISNNEEFMPNNETFNMALFHLRTMKYVGITELYAESLTLMKFYIGLEIPTFVDKQNVGKLKPTNVTNEIIEQIKQRNWMDILLYEEALKMFHRQIDIVGKDKFETQLLITKSKLVKVIIIPNTPTIITNLPFTFTTPPPSLLPLINKP